MNRLKQANRVRNPRAQAGLIAMVRMLSKFAVSIVGSIIAEISFQSMGLDQFLAAVFP
ncbi:MAG: hypothetical protein JNK75_08735 [Betaproteobacteria bacterium]|nr:hypothetical protein [Betaproteobacteria bacterium]